MEYHKSKINQLCPWKNCAEYRAWIKMNRTYNGIVWHEWTWYKSNVQGIRGAGGANHRNYHNFLNSLGPKPKGHVLIRLDKAYGFKPGNVRWGTHQENSQHRGPYRKYSYSRDEELIAELTRRGYTITPLA
jgi:hypothetical protein